MTDFMASAKGLVPPAGLRPGPAPLRARSAPSLPGSVPSERDTAAPRCCCSAAGASPDLLGRAHTQGPWPLVLPRSSAALSQDTTLEAGKGLHLWSLLFWQQVRAAAPPHSSRAGSSASGSDSTSPPGVQKGNSHHSNLSPIWLPSVISSLDKGTAVGVHPDLQQTHTWGEWMDNLQWQQKMGWTSILRLQQSPV